MGKARGRRIAGLGISLTALGALLAPATASATHVSCNFAAPVLTVTIAAGVAPGEAPATQRDGDNILVFNQPGPSTACSGGTPTVANTDTINVNETAVGAGTTFRISQTGGPFAPGAFDELGNTTDEIEWSVAFESGGTDTLSVTAGADSTMQNVRFGQNGGTLLGNLNGDEAAGIDSDLSATNVNGIFGTPQAGADTFTGNGGSAVPGSTGPATAVMDVDGGAGNDVLTAGAGATNSIAGGGDDDTLTGGSGADTLSGAAGVDSLTGLAGVDILRGGTEADDFQAQDATVDTIDCTGGGADTGTFDPVETFTSCDADGDGVIDFVDACPGQAGTLPNGCVAPVTLTPVPATPPAETGERAAALKKCKQKRKKLDWSKKRYGKCKRQARRLPV